jgi:geranylgeranyl transferase type-1 subunit beta
MDILGLMDDELIIQNKEHWIEWLYSLQSEYVHNGFKAVGFRGGSSMGKESSIYNVPHLVSTYSSILCLLMLGDDLQRVDKAGIIATVRFLQQDNGGFIPSPESLEKDIRFVYCACCISFILNDWSGIDKTRTIEFIKTCQTYDGGFGMTPEHESYGIIILILVALHFVLLHHWH